MHHLLAIFIQVEIIKTNKNEIISLQYNNTNYNKAN